MALRILMVCMGNVCRSPMACAVAQHLAGRRGRAADFVFESAGTHPLAGARGMDARAHKVLLQAGYAPQRLRPRRISPADFVRQDLILAMDASNLQALQRQCPPEHQAKLHLLLSYAPRAADRPHAARAAVGAGGFAGSVSAAGLEIPDPYYGDAAGFQRVLALCEAGVAGLLDRL